MFLSTVDITYKSIKICCSENAYNYILNFYSNKKNIFGCLNDLSYGNLNIDKFSLMNCNNEILLEDIMKILSDNTKIEILFNSNNSCEYCNFLFLINHFNKSNVTLIDTGKSLKTNYGILTIDRSEKIPVNRMDDYQKHSFLLSNELLAKYQKDWNRILCQNTDLRYIENKILYSVNKNYFDDKINSQNKFEIMCNYGLSEKWLVERYGNLINHIRK